MFILIFSISTLFCQTNNLTIDKNGNGNQKIILISGLACKNEIWRQTIYSLQTDATVFSIDYYNDSNKEQVAIENIINQILNWINTQKIDNPIIIGHSLGGIIAMKVAFKLKSKITKLIIIDSYPAISALSNPNFISKPNNNCTSFVDKFSSMTSEQYKNFQTSNYSHMTLDEEVKEKLLDWALNYNRSNYSKLLCDYLNTDLRKSLDSIRCPSLILASKSMITLKENINEQYERLIMHKLKYSKKGLHFLMIDDFDWYINEIIKFIRR
jgi:pimeloyl-ACP methyl ester carboxylesterase